ncbi:hypothetical protein [Mycolicibacterium setense]
MHPQSGQAVRFEQLPGGVIRAHGIAHSRMIGQLARVIRTAGIADAGLADQLATAVRRSTAMRTALALAVVMPLLATGLFSLEDGGLTGSSLLPAGGVLVAGVGVIGYFMFFGIPMKFRQLVPAGAQISAEFGPLQIGVRLGGHLQTLELGSIKRIRHADHAFHLTARGFGQG